MIKSAFVSDFKKSDFETKILHIIENAENRFFLRSDCF